MPGAQVESSPIEIGEAGALPAVSPSLARRLPDIEFTPGGRRNESLMPIPPVLRVL
jgi:hypothetical protein